MPEPDDSHEYHFALWDGDLKFYEAAIAFYEGLLKADIGAIDADPDLALILTEEERHNFEVHRVLERVQGLREWLAQKKTSESRHHFITLPHGVVRFIKAAGMLYLRHLENRRNALAARPNISRHALDAVDKQLASMKEKITGGVFQAATPIPLLVDELLPAQAAPVQEEQDLSRSHSPRAVVLSSIGILDSELRSRCLDLFGSFSTSGEHDRLDTVVTEATRILEDRLRKLTSAGPEVIGIDLVKVAFGGDMPLLEVSTVPAEQQAAASLLRGIFGLIRNTTHHRLLGELQPDRVLQILGLIDYSIAIASAARRTR